MGDNPTAPTSCLTTAMNFIAPTAKKKFALYCLHSTKNNADGKPCAHYVVTESDGFYFDLLDRMPNYLADNEDSAEMLTDVLEMSGISFKSAYAETRSSYYKFLYSDIGGKKAWKKIARLLELD